MTAVCRHCHQPLEAHHEFEAVQMPPGCVCNPSDWHGPVRTICNRFEADIHYPDVCARCEHEPGCHRQPGQRDPQWFPDLAPRENR